MTRAKSKKAAPNICPKISNKISTRRALSVVEATRQNILEALSLLSNYDKLSLVATKATFSSLAGFSPVKVLSKKHTWISLSVVSTFIKSPKIFNNRPVNKLVFFSIASISGAASIFSSKKIVKKTKSLEKWEQLLASVIVTPSPFVVPNEILDKISIALSSMLSKIDLNEPLAVLPNVVSFKAKQSSSVGLPVLENWTDQIETELSSPLVSGATSGGAWKTITSCCFSVSTWFFGCKVSIKRQYEAVLLSLKAAFLVELTSSVCLATLKIAKSLVVSESGSFALHDMLLSVSAVNIKTALSVFGVITHVVLKPAGIWQYIVVHFKNLVVATSAFDHWSVLILSFVNQQKTIVSHNRFKAKLVNFSSGCTVFEIIGGWSCFIPWSPNSGHYFCFALVTFGSQADLDLAVKLLVVGAVFGIKRLTTWSWTASVSPVLSEFPPLVVSISPVAVKDSLVFSQLVSLKFDLAKLSVLVESIVKLIGSMIKVFKQFVNSNLVLSSAFGLRVNKEHEFAIIKSDAFKTAE
ncbi:hypothetical protein G9A89_013375 [Geosiphon pyriformis]|nr:hypothetical protein G9A89_013375 [Geosiphon pyriformis]